MAASRLRRSPPLTVGIGLGAVYVVIAAATIQLTSRHVRPLFEGIGPTAPYEWVKPPPELAAGNVTPMPITAEVTAKPPRSMQSGISTPDGQALINLPEAAIPLRADDPTANVTITPVDPATLSAVPGDLAADGNAYRVQIAYRPSDQPVSRLLTEANIVLTVPYPGETILFSPDGKTWRVLATDPVGGPTTIGASLTEPGYYLGTAALAAIPNSGSRRKGGSAGRILLITAGVVVLVLALVLAPAGLRRRRHGHERPSPAGDRRRSTGPRSARNTGGKQPPKPRKPRR